MCSGSDFLTRGTGCGISVLDKVGFEVLVLFFTLFSSDPFHPVFLQPPASCFHTNVFCLGASEDALEATPSFRVHF